MVILHATAPIKPEAREQWFAHLEPVPFTPGRASVAR